MKKTFSIFFILFSFFSKGQTFQEFNFTTDIDKQLQLSPNGLAIYFTAIWCHPCVKKTQTISEYFEKNNSYKLVFVYYPINFSRKKFEKYIDPLSKKHEHYFYSKQSFFPNQRGGINIQEKIVKRIIDTLKSHYICDQSMNELWFGQLIFITPTKEIFVLDFPEGKPVSEVISEFVMSKKEKQSIR